MKRAAAIIGPTPSFVRWAIAHQCKYRTPVDQDIPYQVFRQLRNLREVSIGLVENRVVDNICIHSELNQNLDSARGFPLDEITEIFGGLESADATCGNCPANSYHVSDTQTIYAGCYGWFFSEQPGFDLRNEFDNARDVESEPFEHLPESESAWFQIWQNGRWNQENIDKLSNIIDTLPKCVKNENQDLFAFSSAVENCRKHRLVLHTELIPRGFSDGVHWTIESHCPVCKQELPEEKRVCKECHNSVTPNRKTRRKVLGLRPYMLLRSIYGIERTTQLLEKYRRLRDDA